MAGIVSTAAWSHGKTSSRRLTNSSTSVSCLGEFGWPKVKDFEVTNGVDADALLLCIETVEAKAVIPPKSNRKVQRSFD